MQTCVWAAFCSCGVGGGLCERAAEGTITRPAVTGRFRRAVCTHPPCPQQLRASDSLLSSGTVCKGMPNLPWLFSYFLLKDSRDGSGEEYLGQKWNIAKSMVYLCWCPQKKNKPKHPNQRNLWSAYLKSMLTVRKLTISSLAWKTLIQTINPDLYCEEALLIFMWKIEGDSS